MLTAECLLEQGLSVRFTKIMATLKTVEVLVNATFTQRKWVAYWSNMTMSCLTSYEGQSKITES